MWLCAITSVNARLSAYIPYFTLSLLPFPRNVYIVTFCHSRGKGSRGPNARTRLKNGDESVRIPPSRRKRKVQDEDDDDDEDDDGELVAKKRRKQALFVSENEEKEGVDEDDDPETPLAKKVKDVFVSRFDVFPPVISFLTNDFIQFVLFVCTSPLFLLFIFTSFTSFSIAHLRSCSSLLSPA